MKRFVADALLAWMVLALASYIMEQEPKPVIEERISEFEEDIARHETVKQQVETSRLNPIRENHAARMAQTGSEFVVDVMDTGIGIIAQFIDGFMQ